MDARLVSSSISFVLFVLFVSYLQPMGISVLDYQSHLLQHCHLAYGHEGSSHLSPVLALRFFIALQVQHSYNSSINGSILLTHVITLCFLLRKK